MSGGSFNYLAQAVKFGGDWKDGGQVADMAAELKDRGYADASDATQEIIALLDLAQAKAEHLAEVWHAVEWRKSGDWTNDQLEEVVREWRAKR